MLDEKGSDSDYSGMGGLCKCMWELQKPESKNYKAETELGVHPSANPGTSLCVPNQPDPPTFPAV